MSKAAKSRFLTEYANALNNGTAALFVGAGVSMAAGYPSWSRLLHDIGDELGVRAADVHDLAALAQWSIQEAGGATRVRNVIKEQIGRDRPVPDVLETVVRLPLRHIWTTNYDRLIERAFQGVGRPIDVVSGAKDLALRATPGAGRLYKMHGSIERLDEVVISTDDYELYRSKRGAFLPLLQAHLTSMSMLFIGLSLTDPNIRHVLSLIRESFTDAPPEHFAIVRPPKRDDFDTAEQYQARAAQHALWARDLRRYGLVAVEIDDYDEVPALMRQLERRVAARRVWVSGSWPLDDAGSQGGFAYALAEDIGRMVGQTGRDLVSGAGVMVGSAAIAGFLDALRAGGSWDLDRRLIARPFPQPPTDRSPDREQWATLRRELARQAGVVVFVGGAKVKDGSLVPAQGVLEEYALAHNAGAFLLPIAASGGAAAVIAAQLEGSSLPASGPTIMRPSDEELRQLADTNASRAELVGLIERLLDRVAACK